MSAVTVLEEADSRVDPLGDADAARASLFDPEQFVEFKGRRFNSGLGMGPSDGGVRVIVGGKGAGKTIYLRRLQTGLSSNPSLYVDDWRNKPPATRDVLTIWSWSSSVTDCRHRWSQLWRRAIMRSVTSHLLCVKKLRARVPEGTLGRLARDFPELIPQFEGPSSIVSQVGTVIRDHRNRDALDNFLHHPRWEIFEQRLIEALEESHPMFFILDALDEEFETAPSQWLDCQEGLLRQVLELRANQRFGSRLHVVIGIRDLVYSTTQQGEHASRFHRVPGIKYLRWDGEAIAYFLEEKLRGLDADRWMLKASAGDMVERWLGHEMIYNKKRKRWEVLRDYILRHTRLIPRDVIQMGNALCRDIDVVVDGGERVLHEDNIRDTVAEVSRESGTEQLYIVANHITADIMPREALEHGFADTYIELPDEKASPEDVARAYQRAVFKDLRSALGELQEDRITKKRLSDFAASLENLGDVDVLSILWQHRLLGYIDGGKRLQGTPIFYGVAQDDGLELPREHAHYALHPILIDAVPRLKGVGNVVAQS